MATITGRMAVKDAGVLGIFYPRFINRARQKGFSQVHLSMAVAGGKFTQPKKGLLAKRCGTHGVAPALFPG